MLKLKVKEVAQAQGINDPVALAGKTGLAYATAYRLWQGKLGTPGRGIGILVLYRVSQTLGVSFFDLLAEEPGQWSPAQLAGLTA